MKRIIKYITFAFGVTLLGIQLIPIDRTNPPITSDFNAPSEIKEILKRSCYDCHSNEVNWPWYSYVAPVSWLVAYDVKEGREELNFSEWNRLSEDAEIREEIVEEIAEGEMPRPVYLIAHRNASVSEQELFILKQWIGASTSGSYQYHDED